MISLKMKALEAMNYVEGQPLDRHPGTQFSIFANIYHSIAHARAQFESYCATTRFRSARHVQGDMWSLGCALFKWITGKEFAYIAGSARLQGAVSLVPPSCGEKAGLYSLVLLLEQKNYLCCYFVRKANLQHLCCKIIYSPHCSLNYQSHFCARSFQRS